MSNDELSDVLETLVELNTKVLALVAGPGRCHSNTRTRAQEAVPTDEELLAGHRLDQERRGLKPLSIGTRHNRIAGLMAWVDPRSVLEATREDVEAWLDTLKLKPASRRAYLSHLGQFFDWCVDQGFVTVNPTARISPPPAPAGLPRPISAEKLARAVASSSGRTRCMLLLGALAGLRTQEIAGLETQDVDRQREVLIVRHGKGGNERAVPLHPDLARALEQLPMPASGPLFTLADGSPMHPYNVSHAVNTYLHGLGIDATAHCLRHAFATNIYRGSQDLLLTQRLLGHASVSTTQVYADADQVKAAPAVRALSVGPVLMSAGPPRP